MVDIKNKKWNQYKMDDPSFAKKYTKGIIIKVVEHGNK